MAFAEEGMWLPSQIKSLQKTLIDSGLVISLDEIYSEEMPSLKDAVVEFNGGCSGEFISNRGLLLTNYHCGVGYVQFHSTLQHDYLQNGFYAENEEDELPCPGLEIKIQKKMLDITDRVFEGISEDFPAEKIAFLCKENISKILNEARINTEMEVEVAAFFKGNKYFLIYWQIFNDVRLVAAPPARIGKFGEDSDNWVFPRHTGDFSVFRVYADENNTASKYNDNNIPYQPEKHLNISLNGYKEGDLTFMLGFPAYTNEYLHSDAMKLQVNTENPIIINARTKRLEIIKKAMAEDAKTRIQYTVKASNISNAWKKLQGVNKGIKKTQGIDKKIAFEKNFQTWADTAENGKYRSLLNDMHNLYVEFEPYNAQYLHFREHIQATELLSFASRFIKLFNENTTEIQFNNLKIQLAELLADFYKDFNIDIDKKIFKELNNHSDEIYEKSIFSDENRLLAELQKLKFDKKNKIESDRIFNYVKTANDFFANNIYPYYVSISHKINDLDKKYMEAQMKFQEGKDFYPDANFTLRFTYGKISGLEAADAVQYNYYSSFDGLIAKYSQDFYDYIPDEKLISLYENRDFKNYVNSEGKVPVSFLASNHTTGGNSGSPVFNASGALIGLNFDRTWEGTMSDINFDENQCRNISLDMRFFVFILDKYINAKRILSEIFPK